MQDFLNTIKSSKIPFGYEKIVQTPDIPKEYIVSEYWCEKDSVNIFDVVGTRHPDYIGLSWEEFLEKGKRMLMNISLVETNPDYYYGDELKLPRMDFEKIDDKYYVGGDGNHRTAIAKFLFYLNSITNLSGVTVNELKYDKELYLAISSCETKIREQKLPIEFTLKRNLIKRDDAANYKRDYYELTLEIRNLKSGSYLIAKDGLLEFNKDGRKSHFKGVTCTTIASTVRHIEYVADSRPRFFARVYAKCFERDDKLVNFIWN